MWIQTGTGVFLSAEKLAEFNALYGTKQGTQFKMLGMVYDLAIEAGLPAIPNKMGYGLDLDTGEIFTGKLEGSVRKINWEDFRSF
jgi:hypothetical protein